MLLRLLMCCAVWLAAAAPADAKQPCAKDSSYRCHISYGKVTLVADGDTVDVDLRGDKTAAPVRVRLTGINAMELTHYSRKPAGRRGECHAVRAANHLHRLIRASGGVVRLSAMRQSSRSGNRLRRQLSVRQDGRWVDAAKVLLAAGDALWMPAHPEHAWNRTYRGLARTAAAKGLGIYNTDGCGHGPEADITMELNWDAEGADADNPAGEYFAITNHGEKPLHLQGWWVRDSALRRFALPSVTVEPNDTLRVHIGRGRTTVSNIFWGLSEAIFENRGDGGYLFDPRGNLRAAVIY